MAPLAVIDCVVVHELVHLKIRNHSARFYRELEHWFPGYEGVDRWLSKNAHLLDLSVNPQRELDRI
jgi:predicted metal-dependent hydrolase